MRFRYFPESSLLLERKIHFPESSLLLDRKIQFPESSLQLERRIQLGLDIPLARWRDTLQFFLDTLHWSTLNTFLQPSPDTFLQPSPDTFPQPSPDTFLQPSPDTFLQPSPDTFHQPSPDTFPPDYPDTCPVFCVGNSIRVGPRLLQAAVPTAWAADTPPASPVGCSSRRMPPASR